MVCLLIFITLQLSQFVIIYLVVFYNFGLLRYFRIARRTKSKVRFRVHLLFVLLIIVIDFHCI